MRRKLFLILVAALLCLSCSSCQENPALSSENTPLPITPDASQEFYMVTFNAGLEYWKYCYEGFEEAAKNIGVTPKYIGSLRYDINEQVSVLEQVISKKPAGIAVTCINPDALVAPINKALEAGIPVVTFDADAPKSDRYAVIATDSLNAGKVAAETMATLLDGAEGDIAIVTLPGQLNHEQRVEGFTSVIESKYPHLKIYQVADGKQDPNTAASVVSNMVRANPNIKGIFASDATAGIGVATAVKELGKEGEIKIVCFDTDKSTLKMIKEGVISASLAQGTYNMGYWSLNFLYHLSNGLTNPIDNWKENGINPLPQYVDTGVNVIDINNVDIYDSGL